MNNKFALKEAGKLLLYCIVSTIIFVAILIISNYFLSIDDSMPTSHDFDSKPLVIIDAGHGGEDGGTSSKDGVKEKDLNLDIAFRLCDMLKANGVDVILTRTEDILLYDRNIDFQGRKKVLDLAARLKIAKDHPDAIFVSIHMNAFPEGKYSGLQVYYSKNNERSEEIAKEIQDINKLYLQPENSREIKTANSNIFLLDRSVSPSVLVECGFLSNPEESRLLATAEYRQKLSLILCTAIINSIYDNNS